jgi:hypothetical protein
MKFDSFMWACYLKNTNTEKWILLMLFIVGLQSNVKGKILNIRPIFMFLKTSKLNYKAI